MIQRYMIVGMLGMALASTPVLAQETGQPSQGGGDQQQKQNFGQPSGDMRKPDGDMRKDTMNPREDFQGQGMMGGQKGIFFGGPGDTMMNDQGSNNFGKQMMNNPGVKNMMNGKLGNQKNMMQRQGSAKQGGMMSGSQGMMQKENPGSKDQMMGQDSQNGDQGSMMQDQQQGPSDEEMAAQQKKMDDQRFRMMKKGLSQFQQGVKRLKSEVTRMDKTLQKCGVAIPDDLNTALTNADVVIPKIQAAQSIDDLDAIMDDVQSSGDAMKEWGPKLGEFQQLCDMLKRADAQVKQMKKDQTRLEKRVAAQKKFDLSGLLSDFKDLSSQLEATLVDAKAKSKTDPEDALSTLQDDFFGNLSDVAVTQQGVEMALDVTKGLKDADREIKKYDSIAKRLKSQKKDTADLESQIADLKTKRQALADLLAQKKFSSDDLVSLINDASDAKSSVVNTLEDLGALQDFVPQFKQGQGVNFQLPPGFGGQQPQDNQGGQQSQDQQNQ